MISGKPLPEGWTGKMWAVHQGSAEMEDFSAGAKYVWLTDADIAHDRDSLRGLVARAEAGNLALTSLMARLKTDTFAERALIPAYVYFFQMLYPFAWVNDPKKKMAGAAGGCMLVQRKALKAAGGIAAIKGALIDDCALGQDPEEARTDLARPRRRRALAARLSGLGRRLAPDRALGLHPAPAFAAAAGGVRRRHGADVPGAAVAVRSSPISACAAFGLAAWALMALTYLPTLIYYRQPVWWAPLLPLTAICSIWRRPSIPRAGI